MEKGNVDSRPQGSGADKVSREDRIFTSRPAPLRIGEGSYTSYQSPSPNRRGIKGEVNNPCPPLNPQGEGVA
jgi:hypothetical protein